MARLRILLLLLLLWPVRGLADPSLQPALQPAAQEPQTTPFLMINTEMHVGPITTASATADGHLLATGSGDKSIRLFDADNGRFLRRVYLPLGEGAVGAVSDLGLSPDGRFLVAGTLSFDHDATHVGSLYLIDTATGALLGRIPDLPATPIDLAYAADGSYFAIALGRFGLVLRHANGRAMLQDQSRPVVALATAPGLLAAAGPDGRIRIFGTGRDPAGPNGPVVVEEVPPTNQGIPLRLAFTPDGRRLAVGYSDRPFVEVIDLASRRRQRLQAPPSLSDGNLGAVAWVRGPDATWLAAAGTVQNPAHRNMLLAWREAAGIPEQLGVSSDSVNELLPGPDGSVIFAATDPIWGRVQLDRGEPRMVVVRPNEKLDFRGVGEHRLAVSADGSRVRFGDRDPQRPSLVFDLRTLDLRPDDGGSRDLGTPDPGRSRTPLTVRQQSSPLGLDGKPVPFPLEPERVISSDASRDGRLLVLGTDYNLRLFRDGHEVATRAINAPAWGVVFARDRRILVVASGDGVIRWYGLSPDDQLIELAGLFVHVDARRWVAWMADGRFAYSSFGGQDLVGYQLNGTRHSPTGVWLGFDQVFRRFHDPAAVSSVLDRDADWPNLASHPPLDPARAAATLPRITVHAICPLAAAPEPEGVTTRSIQAEAPAATAAPDCLQVVASVSGLGVRGPDRVEDAALPGGTRALRVQLTVDDGGGGLGAVDIFVDGHNAGRTDAAASSSAPLQVAPVVSLQAGTTSRIRIRAYDRLGLYSETPDLVVQVPGDAAPHEQDLYVLAVGIDGYGEGIHTLKSAVADAQAFARTVASLKPDTYRKLEPIQLLTDKGATRTTILAALDGIARQAHPDDAVLIYLAGHGMVQQDQYEFVPSDVVDRSGQITGGLDQEKLVEALSRIQAQRIFLFLDTCYAGGFNMKAPANLSQETGYFVLTASTSVEEALDSYDNVNGVFAVAVHRALTGGAAMGGIGDIDALTVGSYVYNILPRLAGTKRHQQMATFKAGNGNLRDFPIATVKH